MGKISRVQRARPVRLAWVLVALGPGWGDASAGEVASAGWFDGVARLVAARCKEKRKESTGKGRALFGWFGGWRRVNRGVSWSGQRERLDSRAD